jgi:hypothetical protein
VAPAIVGAFYLRKISGSFAMLADPPRLVLREQRPPSVAPAHPRKQADCSSAPTPVFPRKGRNKVAINLLALANMLPSKKRADEPYETPVSR